MSSEDIYRENYEALSRLPLVKALMRENKSLRRKVKTLETLLYEFPALFENRKKRDIKTEASEEPTLCDTLAEDDVAFISSPITDNKQIVIDLTQEVLNDSPNVFIKIEKEQSVIASEGEVDDDEVEEEVEEEEEEEEEVEEEEVEVEAVKPVEDLEVFEIKIKGKAYYTNNETSGNIYAILEDEDVGPVIGKFVNGKAKFST